MNTLSKILLALVCISTGLQIVVFYSPPLPLWIQANYHDIWTWNCYAALILTAALIFFEVKGRLNIPLYPLVLIMNIAIWLLTFLIMAAIDFKLIDID